MRIILLIFLVSLRVHAQGDKQYKIRTIAFYNVENLFDIKNDSLIFDDDRTPKGKDNWTFERYTKKVNDLSKVLSTIGSKLTKTSADIIGLCEIENQTVINDLVNHPNLKDKNYGIIHFDSPDERGIDVALLYKKAAFAPTSFASHRLLIYREGEKRDYTRDQLIVGGLLDDEQFYFMVNHWPSRSGGEARSKPFRLAAAKLNKRIIDSILRIAPSAKIIGMGDFNDDPNSDSFKKILKTKGKRLKTEERFLFNPMEKLYRMGTGSLAYRDKWNLFDQFYFTSNLLSENNQKYNFWQVAVYKPNYLISKKGRYKGYPFRTYAGGSYTGGYSDHFPVYMYLIKSSPDPSKREE